MPAKAPGGLPLYLFLTTLALGSGPSVLSAADAPSPAHALASAGIPAEASPKAVFLHYRLRQDGTLALISRREFPARLKPSRSKPRQAAAAGPMAGLGGGPVYLSYALLSARGDTLSETTLPDPRIRRVEWQEKGKPGLRSHIVVEDSGDVFLRISEPEARRLRFFKWQPLAPQGVITGASGAMAKASGSAPYGSGSAPQAAVIKTPLAEFELP